MTLQGFDGKAVVVWDVRVARGNGPRVCRINDLVVMQVIPPHDDDDNEDLVVMVVVTFL